MLLYHTNDSMLTTVPTDAILILAQRGTSDLPARPRNDFSPSLVPKV
jgi:hypothetical protein